MTTVAFCEIDSFCRAVLKKHWPEVPQYDDIRTLTAERLAADGIAVDLICGGFPCQDLSKAGRQAGITGERSGLWGEYKRLIRELGPEFVLVENVTALLSGPTEQPGQWFGVVLGNLATLGYDAEWHCIPAGSVGAPHIRDRIWIVAYPNRNHVRGNTLAGDVQGGTEASSDQAEGANWKWHRGRFSDGCQTPDMADADSQGWPKLSWGAEVAKCSRLGAIGDTSRWQAEPSVGRLADGLPRELDRWRKRSVESYGNAVVPQIPEIIGRAIMKEHT
jgi:DNA (cytosine-5)-methyltransferase 1